jgi:hypothetical protein
MLKLVHDDHPVRISATARGIVDRGARYLPTRKPVLWKEMRFTVSERWIPAVERHTDGYRIWWVGPANDRDGIRW